jgi:hypothetical protein
MEVGLESGASVLPFPSKVNGFYRVSAKTGENS